MAVMSVCLRVGLQAKFLLQVSILTASQKKYLCYDAVLKSRKKSQIFLKFAHGDGSPLLNDVLKWGENS